MVLAIKLTQPAKSTALNDKRAEPYVERSGRCWTTPRRTTLVASRTRERTVVGRWRGSCRRVTPGGPKPVRVRLLQKAALRHEERLAVGLEGHEGPQRRRLAFHVIYAELKVRPPREDVHARRNDAVALPRHLENKRQRAEM